MKIRKIHWTTESVFILGLVTAAAALITYNGRRWFDFFDMSAFLDAGYRVASGQKPYRDFFFHAGPLHPYLHAFFFRLLGFNQSAIFAHLITGTALIVVLTYFTARRRLPASASGGLAAISGMCFYGPLSHPWYDQNALLFVLAAQFLVTGSSRKKGWAPFVAGLLLAGAFYTKSNIGAAGLAVIGLHGVLFRRRSHPAALVAGFLVGSLFVFTVLVSPAAFYLNTVKSYAPGSRLLDFRRLAEVLTLTPTLYLALVTWVMITLGGPEFVHRRRERLYLLCGLFAVSVFSAWTGSSIPAANTYLAGFELTLMASLVPRRAFRTSAPQLRISRATNLLVLLAAVGVILVGAKATRQLTVWTWRGLPLVSNYRFTTPALAGWRCDPRICEGVDEVVRFAAANIPKEDSLLVLPDATVIYGLTGHQSYPFAPIFFQIPFQKFSATLGGETYDRFREHFLRSPPRWLVLHHQSLVPFFDTAAVTDWLQISDFIRENFRSRSYVGEFEILVFQPIRDKSRALTLVPQSTNSR